MMNASLNAKYQTTICAEDLLKGALAENHCTNPARWLLVAK
jgi:hypothetical protein